jgi:hypothetical protein
MISSSFVLLTKEKALHEWILTGLHVEMFFSHLSPGWVLPPFSTLALFSFLSIFCCLSLISTLIAAAAASPLRTPLAEFAIRAIVLLILALFQTADEPVGRYLKTNAIFIDKSLFIICHSLYPQPDLNLNQTTLQRYLT